jgi:hypothetical protein
MTLELTDSDRELLLDLFEREQKRLIHELDHTDSRGYKAILLERCRGLERLLARLQG